MYYVQGLEKNQHSKPSSLFWYTQTMSNAQEFLQLFNKLEQYLDELNNSTEHFGFRRLIDALSKTNEVVSTYKLDLIEFLELRNAIVHKSTGEPIAEPEPEVVVELTKILEELKHPQTALDIAASPVFVCQTSDRVVKVIETMIDHFYTAIPVYKDKEFMGIFTDRSVIHWLTTQPHHGPINLIDRTLAEFQPFFHDQDDRYHSYRFIAKDTTSTKIREAFTAFLSEKKRLGALLITQTGTPTEPIIGIITAWDLSKFKQARSRTV